MSEGLSRPAYDLAGLLAADPRVATAQSSIYSTAWSRCVYAFINESTKRDALSKHWPVDLHEAVSVD